MSDQIRTRANGDNLTFKNIVVTRMAGIREGYRIDSFSEGINLIHGPNGIGKSRTAWALQSLLWPGLSSQNASIIGNLGLAGESWNIELELGKASYQKDGAAATRFTHSIPSEPHHDRYLLTLHDLLQVDNTQFAREIQKEAAGGYDLNRVHKEMNIRTTARGFRPSKSNKPLQQIQEELRKLQAQEKALQEREASLEQLEAEHKAAIAASHRLGQLDAAKRFRNACDDLSAAKIKLESFPATLASMIGDEHQQTVTLTQALDELRDEKRTSEIEISKLHDQIESTGFSGEIPPKSVIRGLQSRLESLQRQESEIQQSESRILELDEQIELQRSRLSQGLSEDQMGSLEESGLRTLAKLSREWQQAQNSLHNQSDLADWLGALNEWDRESLRRGIDLLSRHLRTQGSGTTSPKHLVVIFLIGAAILIILAAILLAASLSRYALLFALTSLPLFWLAYKINSESNDTELKEIRSQYSNLGLEEPTSWTPEHIAHSLELLQSRAAKAELEHERTVRWGSLQDKRNHAAEQLQSVSSQQEEFAESYGVELVQTIPESLELLAKALEEWRRATGHLRQAQSRKRSQESMHAAALEQVQKELREHGITTDVYDAISANTGIEELEDLIDTANNASTELTHALRRLENELSPKITELESQLSSTYEKLHLEYNDLHGLKTLNEQVEGYKDARIAVDNAEVAVDIARDQLAPDRGDEHLDQEAINLAIAENTGLANERDVIQAEISRITTEINQAQRQTRIEEELAREHDEIGQLAEGRDSDFAAAADRQVFTLIQNRNQEVNRPPVFRIANDLFIAFTNGTYRLGLDDNESEFTALEAGTGRAVALDNLSSGTRVQLLLAVRLAFIEVAEQGPQLPLILDETLGNTDDTRAKAIIDATIEIANRGRQVFYFTAQHDEVGKWASALSAPEHSLEWSEIDLASVRGLASEKQVQKYHWDQSAFDSFDVPQGTDRAELFSLLSVPSIDLRTATVLEIDLWYLITDVSQLVELRNRGVQRWGQYQNLHRGNHLQGVWDAPSHNRASARARAADEFLNSWRIGRPEPITIDDLRESDLISDSFWAEVVQCAQAHNWDAAALIRALENGEVSRFRTATTASLAEWFGNNRFITDVEPLDDTTIRARVISSMNDALENDVITSEEIDQLLIELVG